MNRFETEKRKRNLADGYRETKGLKDGHCNRAACQAPLAGMPQSSMRDHETFTDGRLYYCLPCTRQFNDADDRVGEPHRCTMDPMPAGAQETTPPSAPALSRTD